ncbi:hypothetical protein ANCCEY_03996 [Ancylostoma ceylanicum]|uniref:Nucleotide-diphospho-sugar transferase domain-containing protein n=1 Tax=Ancylostoma ceylanicum TaxID=53326 RepID=A0A0D6LXV5_9BILA|nr:hypothetical protein ANCCEY_03996 [Ancylostoma ceylanicum]
MGRVMVGRVRDISKKRKCYGIVTIPVLYEMLRNLIPNLRLAMVLMLSLSTIALWYKYNYEEYTLNVSIGIVSVLQAGSTRAKYKTAMDSMECYALRQNYTYIVVNGTDYKEECPQEDITFQRHCIVAQLLNVTTLDWILFVDSDIGVVNEKVRLENVLDSSMDIIFYDRMFNHEIMAGSYIVRRSNFSIEFLRGWANYESRLPTSFHGRDNGAIHMWLVEQLRPAPLLLSKCRKIWNTSTDYGTLSQFTGKGWARDAWLTNSHWNPSSDFMFHARKEADKKKYKKNDIGFVGYVLDFTPVCPNCVW